MKLIAIVMCLLILYWQRRPIRPAALKVTNLYLAQVFKYFSDDEQLKIIEVFLLLILPTAVIFLLAVMIASIGNEGSALLIIFSGQWSLPFFIFATLLLFLFSSSCNIYLGQKGDAMEPPEEQLINISHYLRDLFSPLFWFVLLGPIMVFFYFLVSTLVAYLDSRQRPKAIESSILKLLDFPVLVLLCFSFSLSGNFDGVIKKINERLRDSKASWFECFNIEFLYSISELGLGEGDPEQHDFATKLARRILFIWLIIISLITLFGWAL
jgi:NADH:ubiquinone oxidoreductase subunit 6 (subunit J)